MNPKPDSLLLAISIATLFSSCESRKYAHRRYVKSPKQAETKPETARNVRSKPTHIPSRKKDINWPRHKPALPIDFSHNTTRTIAPGIKSKSSSQEVVHADSSKDAVNKLIQEENKPRQGTHVLIGGILIVVGVIALVSSVGSLIMIAAASGQILASASAVALGLLSVLTGIFLMFSKSEEVRRRNAPWHLVSALLFLTMAGLTIYAGLILIAFGGAWLGLLTFACAMLLIWCVILSIKGFISWRNAT